MASTEKGADPATALGLAWRMREGTPPDESGVYQTRRDFLDFIVEGNSLFDTLGLSDYVGYLTLWEDVPSVDQLLPEHSPELPPELEAANRRLLYVCPECGDVYCGAITAIVVQENERVVWKSFASVYWDYYQDRGAVFELEPFENIGPYSFDSKQYVDALTNPPPRPGP